MSLFSRNSDLPGLHATARECSPHAKGLKKLSEGEIAVVNAPDISRAFAETLVAARPAAVVNTASFSSGRVPNVGPQLLLDAGITLVDAAGSELWSQFKDGKKARLTDDGQLFYGEKLIAGGTVLTVADAVASFDDAQQSLIDHMEAFFGNTIQFIHSESPLLIDGLGIPDTTVDIDGKKVIIVSPGAGHEEELKGLKYFIREYEPVIIAVDSAADTVVEHGVTPDLIVGNPSGIGSEALRSGARVVLPAAPDGHAEGLERIQDLGIGAVTFPAASDSATDLALLLAQYHGADMIVSCGASVDLDAMLRGDPEATPSALLSRMKVGGKLVDARTVAHLYSVRTPATVSWLWAALGIIVALAVIILIAGTAGDGSFVDNLIDTWNNVALSVQGWFRSMFGK